MDSFACHLSILFFVFIKILFQWISVTQFFLKNKMQYFYILHYFHVDILHTNTFYIIVYNR